MFWLLGSLAVRWPEFQLALVVVLIRLAICLLLFRALDALPLVTMPRPRWGLPSWVRLALFTTTALITASHRQHGGQSALSGWWFRTSCVSCSVLCIEPADCQRTGRGDPMVLADIASRMLIAPQSCPSGVGNRPAGVPFFAVIIYRSRE